MFARKSHIRKDPAAVENFKKKVDTILEVIVTTHKDNYKSFNVYLQDKRNESRALVEGCERSSADLDCLLATANKLHSKGLSRYVYLYKTLRTPIWLAHFLPSQAVAYYCICLTTIQNVLKFS